MLETFKIVDSLFFGKEEVTGSILVEGSTTSFPSFRRAS